MTKTEIKKTERIFTLIKRSKGQKTILTMTLPEFIQHFSYTLEVGASWDRKVNRNPRTFTEFISSLRLAYQAKEAFYRSLLGRSCYGCTYLTVPDSEVSCLIAKFK